MKQILKKIVNVNNYMENEKMKMTLSWFGSKFDSVKL